MNNMNHISESLETFFGVKIPKFFDADQGSGMEMMGIRDPEWKKFESGINILDPQHWKDLQILFGLHVHSCTVLIG
jgi:hypothetical protein